MATSAAADFFPDAHHPEGTIAINDKCLIRTEGAHRVVIVCGVVLAHYALTDSMSEAYCMVNLVEQGWADQNDVARAFNVSARTVRRNQQRFEDGGMAALGQGRGFPQGQSRQLHSRTQWIHRLKSQGHSNRQIARRLGVNERAIRKSLRRMGWREPDPQPPLLLSNEAVRSEPALPVAADPVSASAASAESANPNLSAFSTSRGETQTVATPASEPMAQTMDLSPTDRSGDRLMAALGLLEDAAPLFASGHAIPRAGVLLAIPALVQGGIFDCATKVYGSLGPAFYGLRTSLLVFLLMALWRIKRPEGLKEHSPQDLGRILGLDRAPEVKTLRRKLASLAAAGKAAEFGQALAQKRVAWKGQALGFLYVDGHVRAYHGQHRLPKIHVTRIRLSMPATTDYWVNDQGGDPLFVVTAPHNASLVRMLPPILQQVRLAVGQRRLTFVFDRGGYSPLLFQQILQAGFDLITYRKGPYRSVPTKLFKPHRTRQDGRVFTYSLADQQVRLLKGKLRLRQVTRRMDNGHQTPILTSRSDLSAAQVAYRMFARWQQENFFKYLVEEYALDALADHCVEPDAPERLVPNPARAAANAKLHQAQACLDRLQAEYGLQALNNPVKLRTTVRGFKIAHSKLGQQISQAVDKLQRLTAQRDKMPGRVSVQSLTDEPIVKLAPERKHLTNLMKMVAYQAETELVRTVVPHYRRVYDEGRTLIQTALGSAADLEVTEQELRLTLLPLSSPHRSRAIAALCTQLNKTNTIFPGTRLRLHFAVRCQT